MLSITRNHAVKNHLIVQRNNTDFFVTEVYFYQMHQSWNLSFLLHSHLPRMYKCISPRTTNSSSLLQYFIHREINSLVVTSNSFLLVSIPVEIKLLARILLNKTQPSSVKQYWKIIYVLFLYFGTLFISLLWYLSSNL